MLWFSWGYCRPSTSLEIEAAWEWLDVTLTQHGWLHEVVVLVVTLFVVVVVRAVATEIAASVAVVVAFIWVAVTIVLIVVAIVATVMWLSPPSWWR
jgi:uncharacterized Tic20 family protein